MSNIPVISIVAAKSGSGKTTLLEKLIKELKQRGYRLAVLKHHTHDFEMDKPGKDTWRHSQAGADIIAISSPEKSAIIEKRRIEYTLDELIARIKGVDIIFTEGYKHGDKPKIEVFRSAVNQELLSKQEDLIAIASDIKWDLDVPCYDINDAAGLTNEIEKYVKKYTS